MSIDHNARMEVQELLSRFCQYLDRGAGREWAQLFYPNGVFECCEGGSWNGTAELASVPSFVTAEHGRNVRHMMNTVIIDPGSSWKELRATAYGPVIDFGEGGAITRFYDFSFVLGYCRSWMIRHASARVVGDAISEFGFALPHGEPARSAIGH